MRGLLEVRQVFSAEIREGVERDDSTLSSGISGSESDGGDWERLSSWREEEDASESKAARIMWRWKAESRGSHRRASMYWLCGYR